MKPVNNLKIQHRCSDCKMHCFGTFCDLSDESLKYLESIKITHAYPKGTTLYMEGQPSNGVYVLCQGRVKLSTCSKDGKIIILKVAEPGEMLGLSSSVTDSIHIATAEVVEPCQVNFIRNEDFLRFLRLYPDACLNAVRQLGRNYNTAFLQICSLGLSSSVSDKLATLFLGWCKSAPETPEGVHLKISYTHEEIAEMIGSSRETVTRLIKSFKKQNLITKKGADLIIRDKRQLERIVGSRSRM